MSHPQRFVLGSAVGLLVLFTLCIEFTCRAEDKTQEKRGESWELITDPRAGLQLQAAADYIKEQDWNNAVRLLQNLLDGDWAASARLSGGEGKAERYVSVHAEAERLLTSMPDAGRRAYQREYGPRAAALLEEARIGQDVEALERFVQRYLYTPSGPAALQGLARLHYKSRRLHLAAGCYARLLDHLGPARWTNDDLYQAAVAFHHVRAIALEERTLKQLSARARQTVVQVGERQLTVEKMREVIALAAPQRTLAWPMYRGDAERSNRGVGGPPLLTANWRMSMFYESPNSEQAKSAKEHIQQAEKTLQKRHEAILSAFSPLALTSTQGAKKMPLLVYRNYFGVTAVDPRDGQVRWISPSSWSLQRMLNTASGGHKAIVLSEWLEYYQRSYPQILFENSTIGTLSSDGEYVYVIEDLAVPPVPQENNQGFAVEADKRYSPEVQDAIAHNRLIALSLLRSGALTSELGGEEKGPLAGCYFLGPPLPLDDYLYVLVEKNGELCLLCLQTKTAAGRRETPFPRIVFLKPLVRLATPLAKDPLRRIQAAHLAYCEGILVCPTNAGVVLGFDVFARRLAWVSPYTGKGDSARMHWKATAPLITQGKVVFTPPDDPSLCCVNLSDGSLLWSRKKNKEDLYLAGVAAGNVLIVGTKSVSARRLSTGEIAWARQTGLPSGQGVLAGEVFYVPLQKGAASQQPEICALDCRSGNILARHRTRPRTVGGTDFELPGNLQFVEDALISVTPWEIAAYPQLKVKLAAVNERIKQNPGDLAGLVERASLRLEEGEIAASIEDLRSVLKNKLDKQTRRRVRALLFDALTQLFQRDLANAEPNLAEYKELSEIDLEGVVEPKRAQLLAEQRHRQRSYYLLVARLRESQGRLLDALQAYFHLAEVGPDEEMIALSTEPDVKIRVDVFVRSRIAELLKKATPQQRKELEDEINRRLKEKQKDKDEDGLSSFPALLGSESAARREARGLRLRESRNLAARN